MHPNTLPEALTELPERKWIRACTVDELPEEEGLKLATVPATSVFAAEGEVFCIDDTCTHETYSLADGWVEGCVVECTLHMAKFDLRTGRAVSPPAIKPVATHPVSCVDGTVFVALPDNYLVKEG
ncbi:bifunctional 3-phenylpropionate/cinnamic acid dioxygenase ferredoxin subunit [Streptomyces sp. Li-HN-5-11]|uniref:bifunctional 3-phenylpropionate/cinnamic acid dioxygenase ferredoxin subunit n=1 Tax=Streptomyces sp. Li-HN-5-11 TaxID=3075432 RepID=UPI0028A6A605|nr:bifunctional 3-phenylpropionate/cinnamic acid dioxygenase ferredoxin subunit [Streptomyces sp. Li-HN-5-11]WNM36718.1 bifunctional 3-phenylpropionate/cinnamic acid dioxygenase ferredoxin subunit [Streptomyces sp. Li-HN-5-11]